MIDDKIARVKVLIQKREEIDAELAALFGMAVPKRGRPRKDAGPNGDAGAHETPQSEAATPELPGMGETL
jgi:hypothetical protein